MTKGDSKAYGQGGGGKGGLWLAYEHCRGILTLASWLQESDEGDAAFSAPVGGFEDLQASATGGHKSMLTKMEEDSHAVNDPWSEGGFSPLDSSQKFRLATLSLCWSHYNLQLCKSIL